MDDFERYFEERRSVQALIREMRGELSMYAAAKKAKMHATQWQQMEKGTSVASLRSLFRIARALDKRVVISIEDDDSFLD